MTFDEVKRRFNAKRVGTSFMARCPAHEDRKESLALSLNGDRVLLKCFAGCPTESVLEKVGLRMADLFTGPKRQPQHVAATYEYRDANGALCYRKQRTADKRFFLSKPDGDGWITSRQQNGGKPVMDGVPRWLYRLNQLRERSEGSAAESFVVFIVEGEKDADGLWARGLPATTNDSGASEDHRKPKWTDALTQQLKDIGVTGVRCLPDNDDAGRAHMQAVARSCTAMGMEARIVTLPNLPPKGDVSDFLDAGHTAAELIAHCDAATVFVPPTEIRDDAPEPHEERPDERPISRIELINASDVPVVKLEWLWYARLARGGITLLEGAAEKGKSTVLVDLTARVSRGQSFPGDTVTRAPGRVVMLIAEDDLGATVVPRLREAGADLTNIYFLHATRDEKGNPRPFHLSDDAGRLSDKCDEVGAVLVVIDPLVSYLGSSKGRPLNPYNDMETRQALAPLKELAERTRASVVAIRHYRKNHGADALNAGGGSVAFTALVRVIIAALPDPDDPSRYLLAIAKNNLVEKSKRPALVYEIVPGDHDPEIGRIAWGGTVDMSANDILLAQADADKNAGGKVADALQFLEQLLAGGEWMPTTEIQRAADAHGYSKAALQRAKSMSSIVAEKKGKHWGWKLVVSGGDSGM